ncbi:MAG TPA: hypothetical protein PLY89_05295, partial [Synergistaceae bacterium]|nr:hypothetical protein [Synergistaceae bacterium]
NEIPRGRKISLSIQGKLKIDDTVCIRKLKYLKYAIAKILIVIPVIKNLKDALREEDDIRIPMQKLNSIDNNIRITKGGFQ